MHKLLKENKKGQIWYMDFMIGFAIFLVVTMIAFQYMSNNYDLPRQTIDVTVHNAKTISEALMSEGNPDDWNKTDVIKIGLLSEDNCLNTTKLEMFFEMTDSQYDTTKMTLGSRLDYLIYFEDIEGNIMNISGKKFFGKPEMNSSNLEMIGANDIIALSRYVPYKINQTAEIIEMKVITWR